MISTNYAFRFLEAGKEEPKRSTLGPWGRTIKKMGKNLWQEVKPTAKAMGRSAITSGVATALMGRKNVERAPKGAIEHIHRFFNPQARFMRSETGREFGSRALSNMGHAAAVSAIVHPLFSEAAWDDARTALWKSKAMGGSGKYDTPTRVKRLKELLDRAKKAK